MEESEDHRLDGEWVGFYVDPRLTRLSPEGEVEAFTFPIQVVLRQNGDYLEGEMDDLGDDLEMRFRDYFDVSSCTYAPASRQKALSFLASYPDARICFTGKAASLLEGEVRGARVEFVKRYREPPSYVWKYGGRSVNGRAESSESVYYRGYLSRDGRSLAGFWRTHPTAREDLWESVPLEGPFELTRVS